MAIEKKIKITADTDEAEKDVKKLDESVKDVDQSAKKTSKGVSGMTKAFKGLGLAFKALGIGLIIALVAKLTEAFGRNQKIADAVSTTFETIAIVFNQLFEVLTNVFESVTANTESFDALKKVVLGLLNIAITPLKLQFFAIKLVIQEAQLAWEKSFFGDKNPKTILELNEAIQQTQDDLKQTAVDAVQSGKDIVNNFSEAITEVGEIGSQVINEISEISISNAADQAKALVELRNAARLAIAENELILKTKQKEAELQRQIRDNVELDIQTRKEANDELLRILNESNDLRIANAQKVLRLAELELAANKGSIEAQEGLITAQKDYQDVLETTSGFISEQKTNEASLNKELIDLENTRLQGINERQLAEEEFQAEREKNIFKQLELQKSVLEQENEILEEDIERKREIYAEGTQARVDAENEYLARKEEIERSITSLEDKENVEKKKSAQALETAKIGIAQTGLGILGQLAKEGSALGKAVAVSQAVISTYQGINKALAETTDVTPTQSLRFANAAAVGIAGFLNVANILKTNEVSTSGASAPSQGGGGASAPSFNLVQGTGTNQIAETLQQEREPIEAFVVSGNVTNAQALDRNIVDNATL
jgi:hypothetical protein